MTGVLEPVDEGFERALCVVAHPDDLEYGMASVVARWTAQGKVVGYVVVTSGEAGIDGLSPAACGPLREEEEERRSAAVVGVDDVTFLNLPDGCWRRTSGCAGRSPAPSGHSGPTWS